MPRNKRACPTSSTTGLSLSHSQASQPTNVSDRRTGIVYNVTPHAVGVIVNKVVGNRYIEKRVNIRVEHIRHSKCRQEFLDRVKRNHDAHAESKAKGGTYSGVRTPYLYGILIHAFPPRRAH
jgi:large subunit ribosomal protein L21e